MRLSNKQRTEIVERFRYFSDVSKYGITSDICYAGSVAIVAIHQTLRILGLSEAEADKLYNEAVEEKK